MPIDRIDHITLAQPFEAFDEAGLFYRSVLDLQPSESTELAAPDGLVRSRAYAAGDVRVVLNVPAFAGTRSARELQHVAFACADALATARAMRERGVPLLPVPENYYDDLAARLEPRAPRCWRSCASSACCTTARRTAPSSCTSTRPGSAGACSSRCSNAAVVTAATAP